MESKQLYSTDLMNDFDNVRRIVEMVMDVDIFVNNRKRTVVEARMMVGTLLRDMNHSLKNIGRLMGKDHTTIIHYNRKLKGLTDVDKVLLRKFLKCKELLIVREQPVNLLSESDFVDECHRLIKKVEILEREKQILVEEKKEFMVSDEKRFNKIYKVIEENTPKGHELIVERKIRKLFDDE